MKFLVIIEKGENNYSAYVPDLPDCVTTGKSVDETLNNMREASEGHLEVMGEDGDPIPLPTNPAVEVEVLVA